MIKRVTILPIPLVDFVLVVVVLALRAAVDIVDGEYVFAIAMVLVIASVLAAVKWAEDRQRGG